MSQVERAIERIKLGAQKVGGASKLGDLAGVKAHTARRIVLKEVPEAIKDLVALERAAEKALEA